MMRPSILGHDAAPAAAPQAPTDDWYAPLRPIRSLGSQDAGPGSLAGLHAARSRHLSQFFTPDAIARLMWRIVSPAMAGLNRKVRILDNSVGSGRLLQFANPQTHALYGCDVHEPCVEALREALTAHGFEHEILHASVADVVASGFDVALLNPPFSIHLESANLTALPGLTTWGRLGRDTSAQSDEYALAQALGAADVVVALVPQSLAAEVVGAQGERAKSMGAARLRACLNLPADAFADEGAQVQTCLLVYGHSNARQHQPAQQLDIVDVDQPLPSFDLALSSYGYGSLVLRVIGKDVSTPAITRPATGDRRVRVVHDGRRIGLKFSCGLTEALVLNRLMQSTTTSVAPAGHRILPGFRYKGSGVLDLELHLAQEDPMASFQAMLSDIADAGGAAEVDLGLLRYLTKRIRRKPLELHAISRVAYVRGHGEEIAAVQARRDEPMDPSKWVSPLMKAGAPIPVRRDDSGAYVIEMGKHALTLTREALEERFDLVMQGGGNAERKWQQVSHGLLTAAPQQAAFWRQRAIRLGIDGWLDRAYQFDDLVELAVHPRGAIAGWQMACGKARLGLALILLLSDGPGVFITQAALAHELRRELKGLPTVEPLVRFIERPEDVSVDSPLARINVISYERLRMPLVRGRRATYAKALRRRVKVMVCDEGDVLSNPDSDQSRACAQVSAQRRFVMTGTVIGNYPRDVLPLLNLTYGDAVVGQPYGWRRPYLDPAAIRFSPAAVRGIDAFIKDFVSFAWVTNEFTETLTNGAKREIPKIANLNAYRSLLGPVLKRRVLAEPDVRKYVQVPEPRSRTVTTVPWDDAHLGAYLKVCDEFASWYAEHRRKRGDDRGSNLVALLARIGAVVGMSNAPEQGVPGFAAYAPLTSKHRYAVDRVQTLVKEGRKIIVFALAPSTVSRLGFELGRRGVDSVVAHGGIPIDKRMRLVDQRFRDGDCQVLLATRGVMQRGFNLFQANYALHYDRAWNAKAEEQALFRLLRPQQRNEVDQEFIHLEGGIDSYMAQMVAFKADAAMSGIDLAEPNDSLGEFLHMDSLVGQFLEDLAALRGMTSRELRDTLKEAA